MIWRFVPFTQVNAFENMAIDEAIFRGSQRSDSPPTLRFYGWSPPSISLGYFQETLTEVNVEACRQNSVDIVRRPTGGKAVLHEHDLTYAVVAREDNPLFPANILGTYKVISGCIADALSALGVETKMADDGRASPEELLKAACFSSPSRYELLAGKRKICGSAQVRSRGAFLQHGSILLDFNPQKTCALLLSHHGDRDQHVKQLQNSVTSLYEYTGSTVSVPTICHVLKKSFEKKLGIRLIEAALTPEEDVLKMKLLSDKYLTDRWNIEGKGVNYG